MKKINKRRITAALAATTLVTGIAGAKYMPVVTAIGLPLVTAAGAYVLGHRTGERKGRWASYEIIDGMAAGEAEFLPGNIDIKNHPLNASAYNLRLNYPAAAKMHEEEGDMSLTYDCGGLSHDLFIQAELLEKEKGRPYNDIDAQIARRCAIEFNVLSGVLGALERNERYGELPSSYQFGRRTRERPKSLWDKISILFKRAIQNMYYPAP